MALKPRNHGAMLLPPFLRANLTSIERPIICVIIDTEEDFDWTGPFSRRDTFVNSIDSVSRGHGIFRRYDIQPTYLVDYPVASDPRACDVLGPWLERMECLVGAQLHPWVTPPFEEVICPYNSYPCNLEPDLERRKITALTECIHDVLGVVPRVYKAGRYGLDIAREPTLRSLGYTVDTSVLPFRDNSGEAGGPDFFGYPDQPFWTQADREFLYLPVTHSLIGPLRILAYTGLDRHLLGNLASRMHLPGVLARLRLLERIMLTPEGLSLGDLQRLTKGLLHAGHRVFALSLHSPSMVPGSTPYVRSEQDLEQFLDRIDRFLEFFYRDLDGQPVNPLELLAMLKSEPAPPGT